MSDVLFGSIDGPLELVWDAFLEDDPRATIALEDLTDVMDSLVLQSVADGRITVFIQEKKVAFSMCEIIGSFLSYFSHLDAYLTISVDNKPPKAFPASSEDFNIPDDVTSVVIEFLGFMNCTATFILIDEPSSVPESVEYPMICLGFPAPDLDESSIQDFADFTTTRTFPVYKFTPISQQRLRLESRNKSLKTGLTRARKQLVQRSKAARETIQKRVKQLELLSEHVDEAVNEKMPQSKDYDPALEESITRIESEIAEIRKRVMQSAAELDKRRTPRKYTRREEIEILNALRTEVQSDRQRVDSITG